jgi:outer membrane protein OmpA-like peptidoglycan-associated protein
LEIYKTSKKIPEIYVEGHTDSIGDWKINYEIAYRRALSIKNAIISFGVPADWIQVSDHSEEKLAVPTGDGVGNWRNRRVEVIIIPSSEA